MCALNALAGFLELAVRQPSGLVSLIRHWGGFGLFLLGILDSSPVPGFSGPDILIAILAARKIHAWYYYTVIATAGSLIGSFMTFSIARRAGEGYLIRKFGERKISPLVKSFKRWGTGCLVVTGLFPLPFPTTAFVAIAGVLEYPLRLLLVVIAVCRAIRYGLIAVIASRYGGQFIRALRHLGRVPVWALVTILAAILMAAGLVLARRIRAKRASVHRHPK